MTWVFNVVASFDLVLFRRSSVFVVVDAFACSLVNNATNTTTPSELLRDTAMISNHQCKRLAQVLHLSATVSPGLLHLLKTRRDN
mmetsp:Transcript_10241/g.28095  ORF Transcript_10241/g.28095 Transcript_10241/m.28095 type:complete len:85 (+) Transcript_10241:1134-1388(+)